MASYHSSFTYLNQNSAEQGYLIASFEPDNGFTDTFLGMDQIYEDYYDGTKRFLYGTKYNSTATINISLIKADGSDWTISDNRKVLKWLTGARTASWLDLYQGDMIKYSFLGTVSTTQQYKLDGRIIGISFEFSSLTPWAYSAKNDFNRSIAQALLMDSGGVLIKNPSNEISVSESGVLCNSDIPGEGADFCVDDNGILYVEDIITANIDNKTDDLYSYIYLDIEYLNDTCEYLEIRNETLNEVTRIDNLQPKEIIYLTGKQFIISYIRDQETDELVANPYRPLFGDDFNFVWPRLAPGDNKFVVDGNGNGTVKFSYRYPIKIGDCAIDINTYGGGTGCCEGIVPTYETVRWEDITGKPTTLEGYGITNAYTAGAIDDKIENIEVEWDDITKTPTTVSGYGITNTYTTNDVYTKTEVDDKIEKIDVGGGGSGTGSVTIDEDELNAMLEDILT